MKHIDLTINKFEEYYDSQKIILDSHSSRFGVINNYRTAVHISLFKSIRVRKEYWLSKGHLSPDQHIKLLDSEDIFLHSFQRECWEYKRKLEDFVVEGKAYAFDDGGFDVVRSWKENANEHFDVLGVYFPLF